METYNKQGQLITDDEGKPKLKITAVKEHMNAQYLMEFIEEMLPKFIHHRNQLRLYRNAIHKFYEMFDCAALDIDFSENLTLLYKEEIQSVYYSKKQLTFHSGILKCNGTKSYHIYISDSRIHDQSFVKLSVDEMVAKAGPLSFEKIIIESDNCGSQYKSAQHFFDMQVIYAV